MAYPQHPDTIVIKNEYYPKGLREIDIWNYYQKVKVPLLKETLGKHIIVFFAVDVNKFIVIRKDKEKNFLRLNMSTYNTIISGRSISFHNVMNKYTPYGIIDIDTDNFEQAKDLGRDIYNLFYKQRHINDVKLIYTGKNSFHVRVYFNTDYKIEFVKGNLLNTLDDLKTSTKFTIKARREKNTPNLDLQRNIFNAGFISLNSLSVDGLKCIEIDPKKIGWFRKEQTKII